MFSDVPSHYISLIRISPVVDPVLRDGPGKCDLRLEQTFRKASIIIDPDFHHRTYCYSSNINVYMSMVLVGCFTSTWPSRFRQVL